MSGWQMVGTTIDGALVYAAPWGTPMPRGNGKSYYQQLVADHRAEMERLRRYGAHPIHVHNGRKPTARRRRRG